ncbi:MAG: hypothetical protein KAH38_01025, partial [Candidatus Hydrogenedentes bacterium]|nr:hypothetical protein [Candidatus Hydrogenedentota bacterium]
MITHKKEKPVANDPRKIILWTRRYAQNRTISFLVQWVFIVVMILVIGVAATMTQMAHKQESQ